MSPSPETSFRHDLAVTRTRRWVTNFNSLGCCPRALPGLAGSQRFVHLTRYPQPMQQNPHLSGHRHDGPLLRILASALGLPQTQAPQIRVRSPVTENVLRSLHQHLPQIHVAFLGDPQLTLTLARLAALVS